jgi:tetratricopeptide (TPR) repeat protein
MKNSNLYIAAVLLIAILFSGFECSSTELTSAKLYIQQKNWEKALETLQADVAKNPKSDEGYYLMGTVYSEMDETDKMMEAFDKSLEISNKYEESINEYRTYQWANNFNRGVSLFKRGNDNADEDSSKMFYDMAIEAYNNAIILEPDSVETYKNLAFVYLTTGQNQEAIEPLEKLVKMDQAEEGYQYLGQVYYALGANMMVDFRNNDDVADSVKGMEYLNKSISTLEEGVQKYPENTDMQVALTSAYIEADKLDIAITSAEKLVAKDPMNKAYRYNYGVLLLNATMYAEAEEQLKKAIDIDPTYENAIYNLGVTYVKWGTAINKEAESQGMISEDYKQKYEAALPYLEQVVEQDPTNVAIWELLGKVYGVLGMNEDATNAFNKADELR